MKHNFRLSLFTMAMLALSSTAQAQQISMEDAQTIAQQWLTRGEKNSNVKLAAHPVTLAHTMKSATDNATNIYVFNRDKHGFVIIAGDERVESQILGFCDDGEFNPDIMPDALRDLMGAYNEQIDIIKKVEPEVSHNGKGPKQWTPQFHDVTNIHGPLLTTYWVQAAPYNWEVARQIAGVKNPEGMTEAKLNEALAPPTGCVITALCQIMNYHKWPVKGTGSYSYKEYRGANSDYTTGTNIHTGNDISSNFAEHTYDWAHMRDEYEGIYFENAPDKASGKYNKTEGDAVALLMYDVGVSLNTRYGHNKESAGKDEDGNDLGPNVKGTGGSEYDITTALVKYFGYASTVKARARGNISGKSTSNYTDAEWEAMLVNEINNNRPVFMTGANANNTESHAYVCDGYAYGKSDNELYFHVNWGWGKYGDGTDKYLYMYNGYFLSTAFKYHSPTDEQQYYVYAYKQYAIIGIQPDKGDYWYDWTNYADNARGTGGTYNHTQQQAFTNKEIILCNVYGRLSRDGKYREIKVGDWGKGYYSKNGVEAHFIINNETGEVVTPRFYTGYTYKDTGKKVYASSPEESPKYNSSWTPSVKVNQTPCDWKGQYGFVSQEGVFVKALTLNLGYCYEMIDATTKKATYTGWSETAPDVLKLQPLQYTATVSSANIATLCLDYNAWLPLKTNWQSETDRIKAYYVTDNNDGTVKFNKLEGSIIPQGVPVIIQAEEGDCWFQESVTDEPTDVIKGNLLKGTIDAHQFTDEELRNVYFLQVRDSSPVFLKAKKNSDSAKMTIGAHKAWLEYDGGTNAPTQLLTDGFASDIQRLIDDADMGNAKRYNLAGQQVGNSYHGIIIVNGKKYLR